MNSLCRDVVEMLFLMYKVDLSLTQFPLYNVVQVVSIFKSVACLSFADPHESNK